MSCASLYLKNLEKSPGHKEQYTNSWADYIELVCLANTDKEVSKADVIDRLSERLADLKEGSVDELDTFALLEKNSEEDLEPTRRAEISDKWEIRVKDYFKLLTHRQAICMSSNQSVLVVREYFYV